MTARVFEDSAGAVWEVFEVRRTSRPVVGVSPGLEGGWLAFVGADAKRRLAPFPSEWATLPIAELQRLCERARDVTGGSRTLDGERRGPRIVRARTTLESGLDTDQAIERGPVRSDVATGTGQDTLVDEIERAVRAFAHDARLRGMQAIAAMMALKTMLTERYPDAPAARDIHRVRRWFVEAYYFEREERR